MTTETPYPTAGTYPGPGARVWHRHYGAGVVTVGADPATIVMVQFDHPTFQQEVGVTWSELTTSAPVGAPTKRVRFLAHPVIRVVAYMIVGVGIALLIWGIFRSTEHQTATPAQQDENFRTALVGTDVPAGAVTSAEGIAKGFCKALDDGQSFGAATLTYLAAADNTDNVTPAMVGSIVGAGVNAYCPQHAQEMSDWLDANR